MGLSAIPKNCSKRRNGGVVVCDHMLEVRTAGIEDAPALEKFPFVNDRHPQVGVEGDFTAGWRKSARPAAKRPPKAIQCLPSPPNRTRSRAHARRIHPGNSRRTSPVSPIQDAVKVTRICLAAIKSAKEKARGERRGD